MLTLFHLSKPLYKITDDFRNVFLFYPIFPTTDSSEIPAIFDHLIWNIIINSHYGFGTMILD